jgi:catechol 2,3-dioxygenase-like lactoylglutathione lyase family enzyme
LKKQRQWRRARELSPMADLEAAGLINAIVPMIHVADVQRSADFYGLLGFEIGNRVPRTGEMEWAWLYSRAAPDWRRGPNLMLTRSERPLDPELERVVFYLYATDLKGLRGSLVERGVNATEISYPEYLPNGEFRVRDPDGYTLMIAQSVADTP